MKTLLLRLAIVSTLSIVALSAAAPALADDEGHSDPAAAGSGTDVVDPALWSIAGIAAGAVVLGLLYFVKRRAGGFPANPSWVAPITIMRSRDLPGDAGAHGHDDAHGGHAPAH